MILRLMLVMLVGLIGTSYAPQAYAQSTTPDGFARGLQLDVAEDEAVQVLILPPEVYQTATRDDLGDVRIFNGNEEEVPHALYRSGVPRPVQPASVLLPLFPILGSEDAPAGALTVQVRRSEDGTLVEMREGRRATRSATVRAYVLDASALDAPIQRFQVIWADTTQNFIADVEVATSNDLQSWQPWGSATLAQMRYEGESLVQDHIAVPQRQPRYVRLSWSSREAMPPVEGVEAVLDAEAEPERRWMPLVPTRSESSYVFDQRGVLPVDRLEVALPQSNTLARITLSSSDQQDGPWRTRYDGLVYRLSIEGRELSTPPLIVPRTTDRFWKMDVDPAGGGLGQGAPTLRLGWTPERLLFVARGPAPYLLAVGSASIGPADFNASEILGLIPGPREAVLQQPLATVADTVSLGGPERLTPSQDVPWSRYLLWGALVLGVVFLTVFAARLIRQIDADRSAANSPSHE